MELAIPTSRELESLSPADRWDIEDKLDSAQDTLRAFNDDELRRWVEEGKTQTWISEQVGRDQSTISYRCQRLGIEIPKGKGTKGGRPKAEVMEVHNPSDIEDVGGELVEEGACYPGDPDRFNDWNDALRIAKKDVRDLCEFAEDHPHPDKAADMERLASKLSAKARRINKRSTMDA